MSIKEHRLFVYKANSEIVECTDSCLSFNFDAGSITETGDLYADNPSKTLGLKLINTNDKQYSPHYTKGKIKFVDTTMNLVSGTNIYNLPYETTLMIYDKTNKYSMLIVQDKIRVNSINGVETETINVRIAYLDTTTNNELNYIDGQFAPLLQERARVTLYEDTVDYSFKTYMFEGNGTNVLTLNNSKTVLDTILLKTGSLKNIYNYFETGSLNYFELGQVEYFKLNGEIDKFLENKILSFNQVGNITTITFENHIQENEAVFLTVTYKEYTEFLKFDGYINGAIESDLETVSFNCVDRAYDLMAYKVSSSSFRGYDSIATSDNEYKTVEESIQITLASNICTTSYLNYLNLFSLNEVIKIYNGQDYIECTISAITSSSITLTSAETLTNGTYTIYKIYVPSLSLENFIQNCLNDTGLPYNLFLGSSFYEFAYLPKNDEMQYNDLWNFFQDILIKTGNILSFENVNGNFELLYRKIPTTFGTSKYTISDRHILQGTTFSMTGENVRNSYYLKYSNYESGSYVDTELIVDDFTLSSYQCTILTERNILSTDEVLAVNDIVRINSEYLEVRQVLSSGIYKLNKNASESGTFSLYLSGDSTNEYGLKRAYYELDSTSQIDTQAEAVNFLNLVLAQTKYPISTYVVKLNGNDYDLYNYDTITVNSPRLSLFNETMFVQSVAYDNNGGSKVLTITLTKIMQTGKYKYKEMITERGLNSVVTTNKNTTNDVFPPPQKLVALDPAIDDLQDYNVYSYVSWNDFIGRTVAQWEVQYSTSSTFDTYETLTLNTTSLKLFLKEQKLYYIRVRGVGKEQVKGQWATTTVDASKYLIENPIQNGTWYIRLFEGNDEIEYFNQFNKLGYDGDYIFNNVSNIQIIPKDDAINYINLHNENNSGILYQISLIIATRTNLTIPFLYNLILNSTNNSMFRISNVISDISLGIFSNLKSLTSFGDGNCKIYTYNCKFGISTGINRSGINRYIKNIDIISKLVDNSSRSRIVGFYDGFSNDTLIENCNFNFIGDNTSVYLGVEGFTSISNINNCKSDNCTQGFLNCNKMNKNKATNCITKYNNCYASSDTSVLIPTGGSDSSTYGWNI